MTNDDPLSSSNTELLFQLLVSFATDVADTRDDGEWEIVVLSDATLRALSKVCLSLHFYNAHDKPLPATLLSAVSRIINSEHIARQEENPYAFTSRLTAEQAAKFMRDFEDSVRNVKSAFEVFAPTPPAPNFKDITAT